MAYNFYGGGNTMTPANQWGVGNGVAAGVSGDGTPNTFNSSSFNLGQNAPVDYNSMSSWGMPNTSLSTPSVTGGFGGFASSTGSNAPGGIFGNTGLGMNIPTLQLGFQGLSSLANLYGGLKSLGLAQNQFDFQKQMTQKNYANSVASYNTALTDKATARGVTENQNPGQVQGYINANKLS
jgi:hypothetical protein